MAEFFQRFKPGPNWEVSRSGLMIPDGTDAVVPVRYKPKLSLPPDVPFPADTDLPTREALLQTIQQLDKDELLLACGAVNLVLADNTHTERSQFAYFIRELFLDLETGRILEFMRAEGLDHEKLVIFSRAHVLELLRWTALHGKVIDTAPSVFYTRYGRSLFAKALLLAGKIWADRLFSHWDKCDFKSDISRWAEAWTVRNSLAMTMTGMNPYISAGRFLVLIQEGLYHRLPEAEEHFETKAGLTSATFAALCFAFNAQYIVKAAEQLQIEFQPYNRIPINKIFEDHNEVRPELESFIRFIGQDVDAFSNAVWKGLQPGNEADLHLKLGAFRSAPLFTLSDGTGLIADPALFLEIATLGPLFGHSDPKNVFGTFGDVFEGYVIALLTEVYGQGPLSVLSPDVREKHDRSIQIADAYIDYGNIGIIIEAKAVFLSEDTLLASAGSDKFLDLLRERYGAYENGGKTSVKGVAQLARNIRNWTGGVWTPEPDFLQHPPGTIFPVLVVYDCLLDAPLTSEFLAEEFDRLLQPEDKDGHVVHIKNRAVHRLIVISIDVLEKLQLSLQHFTLHQVLRAYSESCPDRIMPFENFIADSTGFWLSNTVFIAEKGVPVGQMAASLLWPDESSV